MGPTSYWQLRQQLGQMLKMGEVISTLPPFWRSSTSAGTDSGQLVVRYRAAVTGCLRVIFDAAINALCANALGCEDQHYDQDGRLLEFLHV